VVGTPIPQHDENVPLIGLLPGPVETRACGNAGAYWPNTLRTSSSHLEGCERRWSLSTKRLIGENGVVTKAELVQVAWSRDEKGRWQMSEVPGSEEIVEVDLVLLAMGFTQPVHQGLLESLGVDFDPRNNVKVNNKKQTSKAKVFAADHVEKGASLVVHAIEAGKVAAAATDAYLRGMEF